MRALDLRKISRFLLVILLFELFVGGGGRLLAWGPVSLRMVLFACAILLSALHILKGEKFPKVYAQLLILFAILITLGVMTGIYHGSTFPLWWEDVKPLLYLLILPFFFFAVDQVSTVKRIAQWLGYSGIFLSLCFLAVLVLIHTDIMPFLVFYETVKKTEEFFFRGELTFFYKGFLYLSVGFMALYFTGKSRLLLLLPTVALLLTITRGFWLALLVTYAIYFWLAEGLQKRFVYLGACVLLSGMILFQGQSMISSASRFIDQVQRSEVEDKTAGTTAGTVPDLNPRLLGDRAHSDDARWRQIKQVVSEVNLYSLFLGHGFGQGTALRPVHMEITYLEVFHKQGIAGLLFWACIFLLLYRKFRESGRGPLACVFFYSALFVFIQSTTNQYVNNPIGLGLVSLAIVCLDRLAAMAVK